MKRFRFSTVHHPRWGVVPVIFLREKREQPMPQLPTSPDPEAAEALRRRRAADIERLDIARSILLPMTAQADYSTPVARIVRSLSTLIDKVEAQ